LLAPGYGNLGGQVFEMLPDWSLIGVLHGNVEQLGAIAFSETIAVSVLDDVWVI
jgi:hypothetical protein